MRQRRRDGEATKDEILRVFAEMVARDGYSETSVADIASALGLSKGTVVHHFSSKLKLLELVQVAYMERRLAEGQHVIATLSTPSAQLAGLIYALLKCHRDDRASTLVFTRELVRFASSDELGAVRAQRDAYRNLIHGCIARGMDQGEFRSADADIVTFQIFGMCNWAWTWYRPDGNVAVEDIARTYFKTLHAGLSSEPDVDLDAIDRLVDEGIEAVRRAPKAGRSFAMR
jgi:AcrR family transcriptional regulator